MPANPAQDVKLPELDVTDEDMQKGLDIAHDTPGAFLKTQGDCNLAARLACRERQLLAEIRKSTALEHEINGETGLREMVRAYRQNMQGLEGRIAALAALAEQNELLREKWLASINARFETLLKLEAMQNRAHAAEAKLAALRTEKGA